MMRLCTVLAAVIGMTLPAPIVVAADPAPPAFTLSGNKSNSISMLSINGDTTITLNLVLDKTTSVSVVTKDADTLKPFQAASAKNQKDPAKRLKELEKRLEEADKQLTEAVKVAKENKDDKKVKELMAENEKLSDEYIKDVQAMLEAIQQQPAVAEGALTYKNKQWKLVGTMRPFDPDTKDKGGKLGTCSIQGDVVSGEFKAGEVKSTLAIRAGDLTIVLTGPGAKDAVKGGARATGTLRLGKSGEAVLEAAKIEAVKK